jgi:hypothetical protein
MRRRALAQAHAWVGGLELDAEDAGEARGHLARSLWHRPGQPRTLALFLAACLPRSARGLVRRAYHAVKRPAAGAHAPA